MNGGGALLAWTVPMANRSIEMNDLSIDIYIEKHTCTYVLVSIEAGSLWNASVMSWSYIGGFR
jgi:hypothetical protein